MTSPVIGIDPGVVRDHAAGQRADADRFFDSPPPDDPGSDEDDPTRAATGDFTNAVKDSRDHLHAKSHRHAHAMDVSSNLLQNQDEQNTQAVNAVSPKDQAGIMSGTIKDVLGMGSGLLSPLTSSLTTMLTAGENAAATGANAGISAATTASKAAPAAPPVGAGAQAVGSGAGNGDRDAAQTRPAAASTPLGRLPGGAPTPLRPGYAHTETQDRDEATVRPVGMMPGLGGLGGQSGAPPAKAGKTVRIVTDKDKQEEGQP